MSRELLDEAIRDGAVLRVRPKAMTAAVILASLLPIVYGSGTGSEVMSRIAPPMLRHGDRAAAVAVRGAGGVWVDEEEAGQSAGMRSIERVQCNMPPGRWCSSSRRRGASGPRAW
jgi:Cu(I)/Ag(I) efflux system membrane protein CusA/SilA